MDSVSVKIIFSGPRPEDGLVWLVLNEILIGKAGILISQGEFVKIMTAAAVKEIIEEIKQYGIRKPNV